MRRAISFGAYAFPATVPAAGPVLEANFAEGQPTYARLAGASGGVDDSGADPAPAPVGAVRVRFALAAATPADMQSARDAALGLVRVGQAPLTVELADGRQRWALARAVRVSIPVEHDAIADRLAFVTIDFQVAYPRWYSTAAGSPASISASGASTDGTVTASGTAAARPVITIDPSTAISSGGLVIRRMVDAVAVDEITYAAALLSTDVLVVDCQTLTVRKNGTDAYENAYSAKHPAWMRLQPGANLIRVILGAGEAASVSLAWADEWY